MIFNVLDRFLGVLDMFFYVLDMFLYVLDTRGFAAAKTKARPPKGLGYGQQVHRTLHHPAFAELQAVPHPWSKNAKQTCLKLLDNKYIIHKNHYYNYI